MRIFILLLVAFFATSLSACTHLVSTKVHQINDLASSETNTGSFKGIEAIASGVNGTDIKRVNVIYIHGIGWTENAETPELGNSFLRGIAGAYSGVNQDSFIVNRCRLNYHDISAGEYDHTFIETEQDVFYETGLKGTSVKIKRLACMDKQILSTDSNIEFVVYRVFWDEAFWDSLQAPHVGYDDAYGRNVKIAPLRKRYNREFKDDIVNYGFSDAVMYLGPAGEQIREGIYAAICSAALDASGFDLKQQSHIVTKAAACNNIRNHSQTAAPFVFVTESLGSKILYDVIKSSRTDGHEDMFDKIVEGSEVFMFANQIPLLSLSDLGTPKSRPGTYKTNYKRPRIIALTELNDFLSYELVPFYETLYSGSYDLDKNAKRRTIEAINAPGVRAKMIDDIGFDIIDMRVEFADPLIPLLKNLVDPKQAHSGHSKQPMLMQYLLCGAARGQLKQEGCLAAKSNLGTK